MRTVSVILFLFLFYATALFGQQVRPASSDKIYHEIAQMRHLTNVLYVAAHPDDENTRLLAWLVNDKNIRTAYLSLTRGDGGQNILGSEQGDALGLIRTHELMEARKLDGAEQFFSRAIDFGFSKSYQETFKHWDKDTLTNDAVWVIRKFRPDVIICRFPPDTLAGHGQHAASAIIGAAAFKAAGDRARYTHQLKYYSEWQPTRIFWNTYKFGDRNTTSESQLKIPVGDYVATMGMGTGELAGNSRSVHKSQGAGTPSVPGIQTEYFKLVDGAPVTESLFDGIDITWGRVGRKDIGDTLKAVLDRFNFRHPDQSLPALLRVRKMIASVKDEYWRNEKTEELNKVILDCTGLMAEIYTKKPEAVAGSSLPFTLHVIARSQTPVALTGIHWGNADSSLNLSIGNDTLRTFEHSIKINANTPVTEPYWLSKNHVGAFFTIPNDTILGYPETPNILNASISLSINGEAFQVTVPLSYKKTDPVKGDVVEQLRIIPAASVEFTDGLVVAGADSAIRTRMHVQVASSAGDGGYTAAVNDRIEISRSLHSGIDTLIPVSLKEGNGNNQIPANTMLSAGLTGPTGTYKSTQHLIQYSHLPALQYYTDAKVKVVHKTWKTAVRRIGYVEGAGDLVPAVLREAGLQVDLLKEADLKDAASLKKYDAIITGIRAVNVEKRMATWLPVLLQYAEAGGTLVMQYNTLQDMVTTKMGPYPFSISNLRVTEEDATVTLLDPKSRILNYPNKIVSSDFDGWVQERGLYFASKWDDKYTPLFSMHDANEQPLNGCTLYTKTGKGHYIYTTLSFSRQLPAGNEGAIKLLMNMLSVGK